VCVFSPAQEGGRKGGKEGNKEGERPFLEEDEFYVKEMIDMDVVMIGVRREGGREGGRKGGRELTYISNALN